MIKNVPRLIIEYNLIYQNVNIYEDFDITIPRIFEDSTFVFSCKDGLFMVPIERINLIHYYNGRFQPPANSLYIKRITLNYEITHSSVYLIDESLYSHYGIPLIFGNQDQFVFVSPKEGVFITSDKQIIAMQLS